MSNHEEILGRAQVLITARLQDRVAVEVPAVGLFQPIYRAEYIVENEEGKTLMPPRVALSFTPSTYLLNAKHYTTLDTPPPPEYFSKDFVSNLADLYSEKEELVEQVLGDHLGKQLEALFRGRRITLLHLGDLFVTEEVAGLLLLNFVPNLSLVENLNNPFSVFKPTKLRTDLDLPTTEVRQCEAVEEHCFQYAIQTEEQAAAPSAPIAEEDLEPVVVPEEQVAEPSVPIAEEDLEPVAVPKEPAQSDTTPTPAHDSEYINSEEPITTTPIPEPNKKRQKAMKPIIVLLIALLIVVAGVIYWQSLPQAPSIEYAEVPKADTLSTPQPTTEPAVASLPQKAVPLDTIALPRGASLATLARQYYNNSLFWVYLYIANADNIKNPDILTPGQRIIVPPLECYNLKSDANEANKEAKAWATVILNKRFYSYEEQRPQLQIQP